MERLTERKIAYPACDKKGNLTRVDYIEIKNKGLAQEKLCQLEDLEEEIGVDFITLVKMLKDDVYINTGGVVGEIGNIYKEQIRSIEHWPVWGFTVGDDDEMKVFHIFKDRGKTWALEKEEFYETLSK